MSEPVQIHVETKPTSRLVAVAFQAAFWAMLVGAIGVSRTWFGGSVLVEILAAIGSVAMLFKAARHHVGREIQMSVREVDAWITDGSPSDVKQWLEDRRAKGVDGLEKVAI